MNSPHPNPRTTASATGDFDAAVTMQMLRMSRRRAAEANAQGNNGEVLAWMNVERHLVDKAKEAGWLPLKRAYIGKAEDQVELFQ